MKVSNLTSNRSGEAVRNQFCIAHDGYTWFQSYDSMIAKWGNNKLVLGKDWDYSSTTKKYLHQWMNENCYHFLSQLESSYSGSFGQIIQKAIDNGDIVYGVNMD